MESVPVVQKSRDVVMVMRVARHLLKVTDAAEEPSDKIISC